MAAQAIADFASEINAGLAAGESQRSIARRLGISQSGISNWVLAGKAEGDGLSEDPTAGFEEIPIFIRDYSHLDKLHLYPLSDVHIGSPAHNGDRWQEWLDYLAGTDNASLLVNGDLFNCALKDSKSEAYDEVMTVGNAKRLARRQLEPVADKIDLMVRGNHEARVYRATGDCPLLDLSDVLDVNYSASAAILIYKVGSVEYQAYVRHGTGGGGGMMGSGFNRLQKSAQVVLADLYISGHTHSQAVGKDSYFVVVDGKLERRRRLFVSSGSFLNYEEYAAERGYTPGNIGCPRIFLDGTRHDAHASI